MLYSTVKATLSGIIIAIVSEVARRSPILGALIVSLPLVSILGILWVWRDTGNVERIASERIGRETVTYVSNIYKYYIAYRLIVADRERRAAAKAELAKRAK